MKDSGSKVYVRSSKVWEKITDPKGWTLEFREPAQFTRSQWDRHTDPSLMYLIYRTLWSSYMVGWWVIVFLNTGDGKLGSGYHWHEKGFFFLYLTNWGYTTLTIDCLIQTYMVADRFVRSRRGELHPPKMPALWKFSWFLQNSGNAIAVVITTVYWIFLHKQMAIPLGTNTVQVHLVNSIYVVINMMVSGHPVRSKHFYQPVFCGSVYLIFNLVYYLCGGKDSDGNSYIYPILDWSKLSRTICFILPIFVALISSHMLLFGLFKFRRLVHNRYGYQRLPIVVTAPSSSIFVTLERELTPTPTPSPRAASPETDL